MLPITLKSKNHISFGDFIHEIKQGNRDVLKILRISEKNFETASFQELLSNTDDILSGVNKVQKDFANIYFDVFDSCLIKHHDNGDMKFVFYVNTKDYKAITPICTKLFTEFGNGIYDDERFIPFTNSQIVEQLALNQYWGVKDIVHYWSYDNLSLLLQYKVSPRHQFSLMITIHPQRKKDATLRSNGTVLNLLNFNINELFFSTEEIDQKQEVNNQGVKFIDYTFRLKEKQLSVFDRVTIRIFGDQKYFKPEIQTHVTFFSSCRINTESIINTVEKLIKIYGADDSGSSEIEFHERDLLEENRFWIGRKWNFNEKHGLWDISNKNETLAYSVSADYDEQDGFKIFILAFNQLTRLFERK